MADESAPVYDETVNQQKNDLSILVGIYWSRNPYSVEVHCMFSLFSAISDCLHCIKALIN